MTTKLFGEPIPRREDPRLIRGEGRYVDDFGHDALAVAFVRSPHAHAKITGIDVDRAIDTEGLVAIYTHDDLPEALAKPLPLLIPHPALTEPRTAHCLAKGVVRQVGEPIAMVVAKDRYLAEDAAERVLVTYDFLPPVVGIDNAVEAAETVHDDMDDNVAAHFVQEVGDAPGAIADAPHQLEFRLEVERSASMPLEGRGVFARWDADDRRLRVYTSTQSSTSVRAAIAAVLDLADVQVEVIAPDVGGGFGVKIMHPWAEELLVPWAAMKLGSEVKWTEDRREHFVAATHERGQIQNVRVGFDDEGHILGLEVELLHDNGAYTPYGLIVPIISSTQLPGPYKLGAYKVTFTSLYTNTCPVTPYRGAGRPQGVFCMERTIDRIAAELGRDRTEVRATNFVQPDDMPYDLGLIFQDGRPAIYDSGDFPASLEKLKALVRWDEFGDEREQAQQEGRLIGIGLACYVEGTGVGPYEGGHVHVETSGRVMVSTGLTTQGQGHETVFAQIVSEELGVPIEQVHVTTGDTRRFGYAVGTFASRSAVMSGSAIALAARSVRRKALEVASKALEANPDDLEIVDGVVGVKGSPDDTIPLNQVAVLSNPLRYSFSEASQAATQFSMPADPEAPPVAEGEAPGLESRDYYSPARSTFANGMHAAVVEIDPDTSDISILRYAVVHDCGRMINPRIVEGQVHGGVAQGVAGAFYERMAYDEYGQLLNASFMDFLMPYATEVPHIETDHLETPSPLNPIGVKGAGEAGVIPGMALFAAAVEDALGFTVSRMPLNPDEVHRLRAADGDHAAASLPPIGALGALGNGSAAQDENIDEKAEA
ncbi:MAG: aerobic carbon-monoxide dehydrogenase large subunit [Egibacteraceae bacterium]